MLPIYAQQAETTPEPTSEATAEATAEPTQEVDNTLLLAPIRTAVLLVDSVEFPDGGDRLIDLNLTLDADNGYTLDVVYRTVESDDIAYNAELLDIFRAVGHAMELESLMVGTIRLTPMIKAGDDFESLETVSVSGHVLLLWLTHQISRSTFLELVTRETGDHGDPNLRAQVSLPDV